MRHSWLLILVALLSVPSLASAQEQPPASEEPSTEQLEARALFERGRELAEARRFSEAADAFRRSRSLVDRPSTSFNLAICLFTLGLHIEAVEVLEAYQAQADPETDAAGIADADRMLEHARSSVAHLEIEVLPAEARVTVDGVLLEGGASRAISVNAGTHVVRVEAAGHAPSLVEIPIAASETVRRAVALSSTRLPARLRVDAPRSRPTQLSIDGESVELGASLELPAGTHHVRLTATEGEAEIERELELDWNENRSLWLELAPEPPPPVDGIGEAGLWIGVAGGAAAVALAIVLAVVLAPQPQPDGGSTGVVLRPRSLGLTQLTFP